jgi:hypothetical protein
LPELTIVGGGSPVNLQNAIAAVAPLKWSRYGLPLPQSTSKKNTFMHSIFLLFLALDLNLEHAKYTLYCCCINHSARASASSWVAQKYCLLDVGVSPWMQYIPLSGKTKERNSEILIVIKYS